MTDSITLTEGGPDGIIKFKPTIPPLYLCDGYTDSDAIVTIETTQRTNQDELVCLKEGKEDRTMAQTIFQPISEESSSDGCGLTLNNALWQPESTYTVKVKAKGDFIDETAAIRFINVSLVKRLNGQELCRKNIGTVEVSKRIIHFFDNLVDALFTQVIFKII